MPQAPMGPGAPSDAGPDGGILPPDAIGPDGMPVGGEEMPPGEDEQDAEGPPFGDGDEDGEEPEELSGPPGDGEDPPPAPRGKGRKKAAGYRSLSGEPMGEAAFVRHLAAALSGHHPDVMARLRSEAARETIRG